MDYLKSLSELWQKFIEGFFKEFNQYPCLQHFRGYCGHFKGNPSRIFSSNFYPILLVKFLYSFLMMLFQRNQLHILRSFLRYSPMLSSRNSFKDTLSNRFRIFFSENLTRNLSPRNQLKCHQESEKIPSSNPPEISSDALSGTLSSIGAVIFEQFLEKLFKFWRNI